MSSPPLLLLEVSPPRDRSQNHGRGEAYASAWQAIRPGALVASYDSPTPWPRGTFNFFGSTDVARTHPHRLNNDHPAGPHSLDDASRVVR